MGKRFKLSSEPVFKPYYQNQRMLLPPSLEELIPENHLVRVVNDLLEKIDISPILQSYRGGGSSSFHPLMLLKVIIYAYIERIYSVRRIAKALRENLYFMWLSGMNQPDFRTINNFRSGRLKPCIDEIFVSILLMLMESGYVDLEHYFVDGSKFLANANKYSYVWKKNTLRYKERLGKKIASLLSYIDEVVEDENRRYGDQDLDEMGERAQIDNRQVKSAIKEINQSLQKNLSLDQENHPDGSEQLESSSDEAASLPLEELAKNSEALKKKLEKVDEHLSTLESSKAKKAQRASQKIKKKLLPKLESYEHQERVAGHRSSYSKTDHDATFFRFKNGDLLPSYNIMLGTQHQYILNYSLHQNPSDVGCFISHLEKLKGMSALIPGAVIGDSAFGSEENYHYISKKGISNYLKYNSFHQDEKGGSRNPFHRDHFTYDEKNDVFICPQGQELVYIGTQEDETESGYKRKIRHYQSRDCSNCSVAGQCKKGEGARTIQYSPLLEAYKAQARENLSSEEGIRLRKKRGVDVESVFGHFKLNKKFRRFMLRSKEKASIEFGLFSIAHNIEKIAQNRVANVTS